MLLAGWVLLSALLLLLAYKNKKSPCYILGAFGILTVFTGGFYLLILKLT